MTKNEMNNQAAQTMPLPPSLPEWSRMDDLGGVVPSEVRQALIAMYQQGYAAALSQTAVVAEEWRKVVMAELTRWMCARDAETAYARLTAAIAASKWGADPAAKRDREVDRLRFPDADFNAWLDAGISDAGHTVYDSLSSIEDAWQGWYGHVLSVMLDENPDLDAMLAAAPAASGGEDGWKRMTAEARAIQMRHLDDHQGDVYHAMQSLVVKHGYRSTGPMTQPIATAPAAAIRTALAYKIQERTT